MTLNKIYGRTFDEDVKTPGQSVAGCPECRGTVRTNTIETVCEDCGLVVADHPIDHGPEWRSFDDQTDSPERTGPPLTPTRHDYGVSSEIGYDRTDARGSPISDRKHRRLARLRREHRRSRWGSKADRNLAHGFEEIRRIMGDLDLPESVRERACGYYRTATEQDLIRGRSIEGMAAASVYAACRCGGLPRTLDEVADVTLLSRRQLGSAYGVLNRELDLDAVPIPPSAYVPRLVSELDLSESVLREASELARRVESTGIGQGSRPVGVAAACVYEAAHDEHSRVTQTELGRLAGVSAMTIRSQWNRVRDELDSERRSESSA